MSNYYDDELMWSPMRGTLRTAALTAVVTSVLVVVLVALMYAARSERSETAIVDPGDIGQIHIVTKIANVVLRPARGSQLEFNSTITDGLADTFFALGRRGRDTYVLDASCKRWMSPGCGATVTIGVPAGIPIEVDTTSGNVTVDEKLTGVVTVATTIGTVSAQKAQLVELSATTSSGEVTVNFSKAPSGVKVHTGSGPIAVRLPASDDKYFVRASTRHGSLTNNLKSHPDAPGFITIESESGDVDLER